MTYCGGFWATVELLVGLDRNTSVQPFNDDIEDWLENVNNKIKHQHDGEKSDGDEEDNEEHGGFANYGKLVDCTFTHPPVRSRLEMLMGSNVVRLTDRKYMLKLMARIRQDHEAQQKARIEERQKKELMRIKKMILNRLMPVHDAPAEIREYPLFQLYLYCDAVMAAKQGKRMSRKVKITESLYRLLYPSTEESVEKDEEDDDEEIYMKKITINGVSQLVPISTEEMNEIKKDKEVGKEIEEGYMLTQEEYDRLHYETEAVKDLKEAQTVNEMYAKAHQIVGLLYSYADEGRYKKAKAKVAENDDETSAEVETGEAERPDAATVDEETTRKE